MKKFISGLIVGVLLFAGVSVFADSANLVGQKVQGLFSIEKNGKKVADAVIINGSAYAPVRAVADATGTALTVEGKKIIMSESDIYVDSVTSVDIPYLEYKIRASQGVIDQAQGGIRGYESMITMVKSSPGYDAVADAEQIRKLNIKISDQQKIINDVKAELIELQAQLAELKELKK